MTKKPLLRRIRYWPALIIGILLLGLGVLLWQQSAQATLSKRLLERLPKDSSVAGVARLSQFEYGDISQFSAGTKIDASQTSGLVGLLERSGVNSALLRQAFDDEFAFARTQRGDVSVFTVAQEAPFNDIAAKLAGQVTEPKTVDHQGVGAGNVKVWQGTDKTTNKPIFVLRTGREVHVSGNADLVISSSQEQGGITELEQFPDLSKRLPGAADGYVFVNLAQVPNPPASLPLTGIALTNQRDFLDLAVRVADSPAVGASLPETDGDLLPDTSVSSASLQGKDVASYLHALEDQRQETDLPRVLTLQNGLASLNKRLGVDIEQDFLAEASGNFAYARYRNSEGKSEWFGALEFDSAAAAQDKVNQLVSLLKERVTIPTRKEVIRVLPDGTQSREIVSETREPFAVTDVTVSGQPAQSSIFPNLGQVTWQVSDRYLVLGSSVAAAERMRTTISSPPAKPSEHGEIAVRTKLAEIGVVFATPDGLFGWIASTVPDSAELRLGKTSGELTGVLNFRETE